MRRTIVSAAVLCFLASSAAAQDPLPKLFNKPPAKLDRLKLPLLKPEPPRPDTSLIDDTRASGLRSRLVHGEPPKPEGLPIGRPCIVYTSDGREFSGLLLIHGKWLFLHRAGDGRTTWVAMDHVIAIQEIDPPARKPLLNGHESR